MPQHFINTEDWSQQALEDLLATATDLKNNPFHDALKNKSVALIFLNPSMRTRTSFELGIQQLGGVAVVLQPGKDAWGIEFKPHTVMHGTAEEHIQEVAAVLSTYVDAIAVRAFPQFQDWQEDRLDQVIQSFARYASVPVINMETIVHPCQELALMMTIKNHFPEPKRKKFLLTWTYHPKPLNTAVANSALSISSKFGMDVTLLCPTQDYLLDAHYMELAKTNCDAHGASFSISHNIESAYQDADFVYAKSWGALSHYGDPEAEFQLRQQYQHFIVNSHKMGLTHQAKFSHCLPLRRNIKATDAVMDADYCVAIEEAENRLHTQKAMLLQLLAPNYTGVNS
ncbi:N-acetylornithine carbamoyltransferase [Marinicella sp. W31]|uniref:N-acetylornithine carbamoyltransferase n=1 Tax=Marinicella sp. W31 TaxID=3023713 RepID=UPI0037567C81